MNFFKKNKLPNAVPWLVFDETVVVLLILIFGTFYYTYRTLSSVKEDQKQSNISITSSDLSSYLEGVVQVVCLSDDNKLSSGSGVLWKFDTDKYGVLTNYHVISNTKKCVISMDDINNKSSGIFAVENNKDLYDKNKDVAILNIKENLSATSSTKVSDYNYNLSSLRKCPSKIPVGTPVSIIGYPSYTKRDTTTNIKGMGDVSTVYRATTNGIISSYDNSTMKSTNGISNENYFVSAKIDIGNSGGAALGKDKDGMCLLGIPTWVTVGDYETQGLIQNIANVIP